MSEHTPGPWRVDSSGWSVEAKEQGTSLYVRLMAMKIMPWGSRTAEANALLIAAAPELLEALESYVKNDEDDSGGEGAAVYTKAINSIAKARGTAVTA